MTTNKTDVYNKATEISNRLANLIKDMHLHTDEYTKEELDKIRHEIDRLNLLIIQLEQ